MTKKIILGTVQFGLPYGIANNTSKVIGDEELKELLNYARRVGITRLDTAKDYGNSIERIGDYHQNNKYFKVISKFKGATLKSGLISAVKEDLSTLRLNSFDTFLFHSFEDLKNESFVEQLLCLKKDGLINKIGVSVYDNSEFGEAGASDVIEVIQLPFNLLDNENERGKLIDAARNKGKEIHIRSVFLQGLFFMSVDAIPPKLSPLTTYLKQLKETAREFDATMGEMALMYALLNSKIDGVLIGVDNVRQLKDNIDLIEDSKLSKSFIKRVNSIKVAPEHKHLLNPVNWN